MTFSPYPPDLTPVLLFGPTASGKSALALALAARRPSVVINADALQVYDGWRALTARPTDEALAAAPHALYGHTPLTVADYSAGRWLDEAMRSLRAAVDDGRRPILVGGAGLYFTALTKGLADIPPIPADIRAEGARRLAAQGAEGLFADLLRRDRATAERLDPRNPRRVARAWEVLEATGRGQAAWAADTPPPALAPGAAVRIRLAPPRQALAERIARRLRAMVGAGALDEVRAVEALKRSLPAPDDLPGLKALGAAELAAHLAGRLSLEAALDQAAVATRRYAKRQDAWGRNQFGDWPALDPISDDALAEIERRLARSGEAPNARN